ncbi:MAG TPA: aminopeptidase P N-terminal domain-containing protein [Acidimicrobiia bacterium]|nr:aminopeptidase P N-terminal domain-containing protein [Acidimicrobiia bacterium]
MTDRFRHHRASLAATIGSNAVALIPAADETIRNDDVNHEFRQDSEFFYLTGFHEPEALAVIVPGHPDGEYHLFVRPRDRDLEIWNGYRVGVEGAKERFQADHAYTVAEIDSVLPRLLLGRDMIYYRGGHPGHDARVRGLLVKARNYQNRTGKAMPSGICDLTPLVADMRLRKSASEIESLRAACELSALGHMEAMRFGRPELAEYQVQAAMEYVWREGGSPRNGYPSIVASGPNACILHYTENDRIIEDGDLVLIDAAAEIDYFSSDITRTWPANGQFSSPQAAVYEVVLAAQKAAIAATRPGATIRTTNEIATEILTEGLVELGLLPRGVEDSLAMNHQREFFMHGTSHWLGMDVHDAGTYRVEGKPRNLEPGMAFTVEPGLYIDRREEIEFALFPYDLDDQLEAMLIDPAGAKKRLQEGKEKAEKVTHKIPEEFRGIGVRIEDDILITEDGHENLTHLVPRKLDEVEALCREQSWLART